VPGAAAKGVLAKPRTEILISGFGGQGVVRMGQILGLAAIRQGARVTMLKSHGTETRGGYVRAQLVIAPEYVDSPVVEHADFFVAFSQSAYNKFYELAPGAILYDPDMVGTVRPEAPKRHVRVPATALSKERFNNALFANSIMLGALTQLAGLDADAVRAAMIEVLPRFHDENVKAFALGCETGQEAVASLAAAAAGPPARTAPR
jgi:2-oxoglutarate ferredoxin oxidoreductase subunit gamma